MLPRALGDRPDTVDWEIEETDRLVLLRCQPQRGLLPRIAEVRLGKVDNVLQMTHRYGDLAVREQPGFALCPRPNGFRHLSRRGTGRRIGVGTFDRPLGAPEQLQPVRPFEAVNDSEDTPHCTLNPDGILTAGGEVTIKFGCAALGQLDRVEIENTIVAVAQTDDQIAFDRF